MSTMAIKSAVTMDHEALHPLGILAFRFLWQRWKAHIFRHIGMMPWKFYSA